MRENPEEGHNSKAPSPQYEAGQRVRSLQALQAGGSKDCQRFSSARRLGVSSGSQGRLSACPRGPCTSTLLPLPLQGGGIPVEVPRFWVPRRATFLPEVNDCSIMGGARRLPRRHLASSSSLCRAHLFRVLKKLLTLGFIINLEKSILVPVQRIQFLGVILDFLAMTMELPQDKLVVFLRRIKKLLKKAKKSKVFTLLEL